MASEAFIKETARAWGLKPEKVQELFDWLDSTIAEPHRWRVLVNLLRGHRRSSSETSRPPGMTEQQILDGRTPAGGYSKAQLAKWGVPWPPPKGWKKKLMAGRPIDY